MRHTGERVRTEVVAGRFYEADASRCAADASRLCAAEPTVALPPTLVGGVAPHAGWVCSGRIAGLTWRALADRSAARTVFLTGSVHTIDLRGPALDSADAWRTPLGDVAVDGELRDAIGKLEGFETIDDAHDREHALEVQLPMLLSCLGEGVRIVPCMIPPRPGAAGWGEALGELLSRWPEPVLVVASSDLTHYGPNYGFAPAGPGEAGRSWASEVNDRRLLDRVERLEAGAIVDETLEHRNACGGGAIAAVIAAATALGATRAVTLEHTDSSRELAALGHVDPNNSVGYASIVFA